MSSTNRSRAREAHISDYYITPVDKITEFLQAFDSDVTLDLQNPSNIILDPCAGGDEYHEMSYPKALREHYGIDNSRINTIDIREDSRADIKGDYLSTNLNYKPYVIITNPPFNMAIDIIKKALNDVEDGGYVIMLLRLNFLGSIDRKPFWDSCMPKYIYVHHRRIGFTDDRKTDSIEYCHMVWQKGNYPDKSEIKVV